MYTRIRIYVSIIVIVAKRVIVVPCIGYLIYRCITFVPEGTVICIHEGTMGGNAQS